MVEDPIHRQRAVRGRGDRRDVRQMGGAGVGEDRGAHSRVLDR